MTTRSDQYVFETDKVNVVSISKKKRRGFYLDVEVTSPQGH